jgi:TolA-binding protein
MKKWMSYILAVGLMAGAASAALWPFSSDKKEGQTPSASVAAPEVSPIQRSEDKGKQRKQLSPEQVEKMKARYEELNKLGEAARNEPDPAKKELLVGLLRAKLTQMADERQAEIKKRIDSAEKELPKLKERLTQSEKNKSSNIEKKIQRILAGELIEPPKRDPKKAGQKGAKAPVAE